MIVKEDIKDLKIEEILCKSDNSTIYRLADGRLLKVIDFQVQEMFNELGESYEKRVVDPRGKIVEEIVAPLSAVYKFGNCCGYTMEEVEGVALTDYCDNYINHENINLEQYSKIYSKLENIVIKANKNGIIMPDMCTEGNILIQKDGNLRIIDYDGLQIKDNISIAISTTIGDPYRYLFSNKYRDGFYHFTSELDKTSLTYFIFLLFFNTDIAKVGEYYPGTHKLVTVADIFEYLGCTDTQFMQKVEDNLDILKPGHYLASDLERIASNYKLVQNDECPDPLAKKLIRK